MKIKEIDENFSGAIAGIAMPMGAKKKKKTKTILQKTKIRI